jgi:serine/threonine protein kinase
MPLTLVFVIVAVVVIVAVFYWFRHRRLGGEYTEDERALLKARVFDHYELKRVQKRGPLSTAYEAIDKEAKKQVTLRILHPQFCLDPEETKSFLRQGEVLEFLSKQPGVLSIIHLLDYGQFTFNRLSRPFIAVEFFDGLELGSLLEKRKVLTIGEATSIVRQVGGALAVALRERVWHHQLSIEAIWVRDKEAGKPEAKLVDFDITKRDLNVLSGEATEGVTKLTFMSPEQLEHKIVDERSDIYSLGVMYYTLLAGRPPFMARDYGEMARLHTSAPPPPLPDSVSQTVQAVVLKCLAKQPTKRYGTMEDFLRALDDLTPEASWEQQPDVATVRPVSWRSEEPKREVEPVPIRATERERPTPRPMKERKRGQLLSLIVLEVPLMFVAFIGRIITKLTRKVSVRKIALVFLLAVVALAAYLIFRSRAVDGEVLISIKDTKGKGIVNAEVALDPFAGGSESAVFTDPVTELESKGKWSAKTDRNGQIRVKYKLLPNTKLAFSVVAGEYLPNPKLDTILIKGDSTVTLAYSLTEAAAEGPKLLTVFVHDRSKNPVASVAVTIVGVSQQEHKVTVDLRGKATLQYDLSAEGENPNVELSGEALSADFAQSSPKKLKVRSGKLLDIDINDFFPYDQRLEDYMKRGRYLVKEKEWKKAIEPLRQVVTIRPGAGSAEAYTLLGQALFEDDDANYKEALKALDNAVPDRSSITGSNAESVTETMFYYRVRALYKAYDELDSSDPARPNLKKAILKACKDYTDLYKSEKYRAHQRADKRYRDHFEDVENIEHK